MVDHERTEDSNMPASIADVVKAVKLDSDYWEKEPPGRRAQFIGQVVLHYIDNKALKHKETILPEAPSRQW